MTSQTSSAPIRVGVGIFWFIGWLFTIAFARLIWWQAILALVLCPYFLIPRAFLRHARALQSGNAQDPPA